MLYWPHTRFSNDFIPVVVKTSRPALAIAPEMTRVDPMEALKAE